MQSTQQFEGSNPSYIEQDLASYAFGCGIDLFETESEPREQAPKASKALIQQHFKDEWNRDDVIRKPELLYHRNWSTRHSRSEFKLTQMHKIEVGELEYYELIRQARFSIDSDQSESLNES